MRIRKILFIILFLGLSLPARATNDIYVIQLVLDGLRYDVMQRNLEQGQLPTLQKHFVQEGTAFKNAYTIFPTVSTPAYISFVTGLGPADSGVPFLEWFDRMEQKTTNYLTVNGLLAVNRDFWSHRALLNPDRQEENSDTTLFERLAPEKTLALYTPFRRGAKEVFPKGVPWKMAWSAFVTHSGPAIDRHAMQKLLKEFRAPVAKLPRFSFVGLYGSDYIGHHKGPEALALDEGLTKFDAELGQLIAVLQEKGIWDKTYIVITSDHGMHLTGKYFKLVENLWHDNFRVKPKNPKIKDADLHVVNRGVSSTLIYARGEKGWKELPDVDWLRRFPTRRGPKDLIAWLLAQKPTDWIAVRNGDNNIKLFTADGREGTLKTFRIDGKRFYSYTYDATKGIDPFGYATNANLKKRLDGTPFDASVWGEETFATARPDAVVQVASFFEDIRTGDILLVNKEGWSFRTAKIGSHGSLNQEDMHVPLLVRTPSASVFDHDKFIRSVDLYPTYLEWFGLPFAATESMGHSLSDHSPRTTEQQKALAVVEAVFIDQPPFNKMIDEWGFVSSFRKQTPHFTALLGAAKEEAQFRNRTVQKLFSLERAGNKSFTWEKERMLHKEMWRLMRMQDICKALDPTNY